jgi:hypothetical protein
MNVLGIGNDSTIYYASTPQQITGAGLWTAVNNLVIALKSNGIWNRTSAIYPYVGGTAERHKFNLKNPVNSDAAFRLTFYNSWTHTGAGATPISTISYADTNMKLVDRVPQYSFTGATYLNVATQSEKKILFAVSGGDQDNGTVFLQCGAYNTISGIVQLSGIVGEASHPANGSATFAGLIGMTCYRDNVFNLYKNATIVGSNTFSRRYYFQVQRPMDALHTLLIAGRQGVPTPSYAAYGLQRAFDFFGWGMENSMYVALNSAIANFQTSLNRNV